MSRTRPAVACARLTQDELTGLRAYAAARGFTVSALLRELVRQRSDQSAPKRAAGLVEDFRLRRLLSRAKDDLADAESGCDGCPAGYRGAYPALQDLIAHLEGQLG